MQQPLKFEMLPPQQQQLLKQSQNSPKRDNRTLLSQSIIHQSYGVSQMGVGGQRNMINSGIGVGTAGVDGSTNCGPNTLPPHLSMAYYAQQPPSQSYFGEVIHPMQVFTIFSYILFVLNHVFVIWALLATINGKHANDFN